MAKLVSRGIFLLLVVFLLTLALVACSGSSASSKPATTGSRTTSSSTATSAVYSDNIYLIKNDPSKGNYLTDFQGSTLYVYDKDTPGVSNYNIDSAKTWIPYSSGATAQSTFPPNITVINRTDGSQQFAWKGKPLYYYSQDKKPGDILGNGVEGLWHIVKP